MADYERFLLYSLRHNRPVKVLTQQDEALRYVTMTVIAMDNCRITYMTAQRKTPLTMPIQNILAASYARGDDGDTLKNEHREKEAENEQNT